MCKTIVKSKVYLINDRQMKLREKILLLLSRELGTGDCKGGENEWDIDNALSLLKKNIQGFSENILDKNIVDYGCGSGYQSVALAKSGANYVLGIETNPVELKRLETWQGH